jgi:hypothetical protein
VADAGSVAKKIGAALLVDRRVRTEFGVFLTRSYARYEGHNPGTHEPVIVPAKHILFMIAAPEFVTDVFGSLEGSSHRKNGLPKEYLSAPLVACAAIYPTIVRDLRRARVTEVPDSNDEYPTPWEEIRPRDLVALSGLGGFAVYRGRVRDTGKVATNILFLASGRFKAMMRRKFGD